MENYIIVTMSNRLGCYHQIQKGSLRMNSYFGTIRFGLWRSRSIPAK